MLNDPGVTHVLASAVGDEGGAGHDGLQLGDGPAHVPLEAVHPVPEVRGGHPGSASLEGESVSLVSLQYISLIVFISLHINLHSSLPRVRVTIRVHRGISYVVLSNL